MRLNGFSLVELVIVLAVAGILMALGMPSLKTMIDSTKTKAAAESILSGLRFAKSEAIKRNMPMRFQLVSTLGSDCAFSTASALWVVNQEENRALERNPEGKCDLATLTPADGDVLDPAEPYIAFKSDGKVYTGLTVDAVDVAAAGASIITFSPLGQVISNLDGSATLTNITVTSDNADAKTWSVRVTGTNGSIKFCDPDPAVLAAGSPLACPL